MRRTAATPREKGLELEHEVASWLRDGLGCEVVEDRRALGKNRRHAYDVDVHGIRYRPFWRAVGPVATLAGLAATSLMLLLTVFARAATYLGITEKVTTLGLGAGLGLILLGALGQDLSTVHIWVECKNRKERVKRADVAKLQEAVRSVRAHSMEKLERWMPGTIMIVSSSGFDVDALSVAREHKIECYVPTEGGAGFRRVR